jgi:hypothetical protein
VLSPRRSECNERVSGSLSRASDPAGRIVTQATFGPIPKPVRGQVEPSSVVLLDESYLAPSRPSLELLLTGNRGCHVQGRLEMNESIHVMPAGKRGPCAMAMLVHASRQVVGHPDVHAPGLAREDVDVELSHVPSCPVGAPTTPSYACASDRRRSPLPDPAGTPKARDSDPTLARCTRSCGVTALVTRYSSFFTVPATPYASRAPSCAPSVRAAGRWPGRSRRRARGRP